MSISFSVDDYMSNASSTSSSTSPTFGCVGGPGSLLWPAALALTLFAFASHLRANL